MSRRCLNDENLAPEAPAVCRSVMIWCRLNAKIRNVSPRGPRSAATHSGMPSDWQPGAMPAHARSHCQRCSAVGREQPKYTQLPSATRPQARPTSMRRRRASSTRIHSREAEQAGQPRGRLRHPTLSPRSAAARLSRAPAALPDTVAWLPDTQIALRSWPVERRSPSQHKGGKYRRDVEPRVA